MNRYASLDGFDILGDRIMPAGLHVDNVLTLATGPDTALVLNAQGRIEQAVNVHQKLNGNGLDLWATIDLANGDVGVMGLSANGPHGQFDGLQQALELKDDGYGAADIFGYGLYTHDTHVSIVDPAGYVTSAPGYGTPAQSLPPSPLY
jgi:hypothetical protein